MHEENGKPQNSTETGCVSSPSLRLILLVLPAKENMSKIIDLTKVVEQSWALFAFLHVYFVWLNF